MNQVLTVSKSKALLERATEVMPGGVNSPARSCKAVESDPLFISKADGSMIYDVDDNDYIDYVGSWGAMILGHRHPRVLSALEDALTVGTSFGAPCRTEVELAELICEMVPSIEMVRMVNSGTEATMSAIRLARAFTKKNLIIKFDGCYHGHSDGLLIEAGSGLASLGISSSPGVPEDIAKLTISLPYNDLPAVKKAFTEHKKNIAAIIVEPVVGNSGVIEPSDNYLTGLRELANKNNCLLIFDEVMTGFRLARGGAQEVYEIEPDLTCLGKIIGGGLPVGAYGGTKKIMEMVAPAGPVYQAGTLSGNPLAMHAGLAQLRSINNKIHYERLKELTSKLAEGIEKAADKKNIKVRVNHVCGMLSVFLSKKDVTDFESASKADKSAFAELWKCLLDNGIYWPPSQFEAAFISLMHTARDVEKTIEAFEKSFAEIGK